MDRRGGAKRKTIEWTFGERRENKGLKGATELEEDYGPQGKKEVNVREKRNVER